MNHREIGEGARVGGIERNCLAEVRDGCLVILLQEMGVAQIVVHMGKLRALVQDRLEFGDRLIQLALRCVDRRQRIARLDVLRVLRQRVAISLGRLVQPVLALIKAAHLVQAVGRAAGVADGGDRLDAHRRYLGGVHGLASLQERHAADQREQGFGFLHDGFLYE